MTCLKSALWSLQILHIFNKTTDNTQINNYQIFSYEFPSIIYFIYPSQAWQISFRIPVCPPPQRSLNEDYKHGESVWREPGVNC